MQKATVIYRSPVGDSREVQMGGVTFTDGKSVEINSYDNPHLLSKLQGNPMFDVQVSKEDNQPPPKVKRGRPSKADIAAAKEAADQADKEAKDAKDKADAAKSDHEKLSKATDVEVTRPPAEGKTADMKAGMDAATAHDFEKDRQTEIARRDAQAKGISPKEDQGKQGPAAGPTYPVTPGSPGSPLPKPQGESNPVGLTGTSSAPTPSAPPPAGS